jgi:hypothetical protein
MISHKYKCIFIHIPRCGGTSIEKLIQGKNQWLVEEKTKHLTSTQAKKIYSNYWDEYFKFSFVRNPYQRVVSCLNFADYFGLNLKENGDIDFSKYKQIFGFPKTIEFDYRFDKIENIYSDNYQNNCVYQNMLFEPIDKIFKFENYKESIKELCDTIKIQMPKQIPHEIKTIDKIKKQKNKILKKPFNINEINNLYLKDFNTFNYELKTESK